MRETIKKTVKTLFSFMPSVQAYHLELDFQKVNQHAGGKWLIHGTKRCKDNQMQSLELPGSICY